MLRLAREVRHDVCYSSNVSFTIASFSAVDQRRRRSGPASTSPSRERTAFVSSLFTSLRPSRSERMAPEHYGSRRRTGGGGGRLSITHNCVDLFQRGGTDFLESPESVVIPCRAPESRSRVLDGDEKQQIGVD